MTTMTKKGAKNTIIKVMTFCQLKLIDPAFSLCVLRDNLMVAFTWTKDISNLCLLGNT